MSITKITQQYIANHPSIKDCLFKGLINYSALAREIGRAHRIRNLGAIVVACRRYQARVRTLATREQVIRNLIAHSKLHVKTKMGVLVVEKPREMMKLYDLQSKLRAKGSDLYLIEGDSAVTLLTSGDALPYLRERLRQQIIEEQPGLAFLTLIFDKRIATTSGVVSFIYGLLAENGINVLEEASCFTDVMIAIAERDLTRTLQALNLEE